jgi:hypothetical protein
MADLTPAQALDLIHRSMLTSVATSEFNAAGGYDKVYNLAKSSGGNMGAPSDEAIKKYGPTIAAQGYGNMSYAPGSTVNDSALAAAGYDNYYDQALKKPSTSYLQKQILELQNSYKDLLAKSKTPGTTTSTGTTTGGATVDAGGTTIDTSNSGAGTSGVVYGPDGKMYSSAASAIAAGVTNYTRTKPVGAIAGADTLGGGTAARGFMSNDSQVGNVNTGGLIANQSQQLFNTNPNVSLPPGVVNPFKI